MNLEHGLLEARRRLDEQERHSGGLIAAEKALLVEALGQLTVDIEGLQVARDELARQNEALAAAHRATARERQRYQELLISPSTPTSSPPTREPSWRRIVPPRAYSAASRPFSPANPSPYSLPSRPCAISAACCDGSGQASRYGWGDADAAHRWHRVRCGAGRDR
jgi:hypothetical protein